MPTSIEKCDSEQNTGKKKRERPNQTNQITSKTHKTPKSLKNIQLVKKKWGNGEIQILTEEILENAENANTRQVWQRINQLKNHQNNQKRKGFLNEQCKLKVRTQDVISIMSIEIKKRCHQAEDAKTNATPT